jgi:uncharacterized protein YjiS (DUF1127 family)
MIADLTNPMEIEMAFADAASNAHSDAANPVAAAFAAAARAVVVWRAERARRVALADLLAMEPHRLRDLGISRYDVQKALTGPSDHQ